MRSKAAARRSTDAPLETVRLCAQLMESDRLARGAQQPKCGQ